MAVRTAWRVTVARETAAERLVFLVTAVRQQTEAKPCSDSLRSDFPVPLGLLTTLC
jgi:hypothetical protein